jgi:hypothetical protein
VPAWLPVQAAPFHWLLPTFVDVLGMALQAATNAWACAALLVSEL